ncbi:MAG: N-6 DNA methylase [Oscillospiraceae bacterium]|nr:N-6 DNA methylase [Oscillospiraceae bacterium]
MTNLEQTMAAKKFAEYWKDKGYEKGESQPFWLSLLSQVYGIKESEKFIIFEDQVHIDHTSFIDGNIPSTHVLIEQKSINKDLRQAIKQSDGTLLNPFQQAKRYAAELPYSQRPRWIVTCNFKSFLVYDMENPSGEPEEILLENLEKEYYRLEFLIDSGNEHLKREMEVSIKAGEIVGRLYDEILKQYINPTDEHSLKSLNMLCVRLVFCLYAEDAGIFGKHSMFHDYLIKFDAENLRDALINLFKVLDIKLEDRDPYMNEDLASFPYVNGGLFSDENIEIPKLNQKVKEMLLSEASEDFDWSEISPTIFGAVFESTLNPETRRSGGMHYTSIENIHKVIDPLFLDELKDELNEIKQISIVKTRKTKLEEFQKKLASLTFLDPACGSGNFLTETYLSLRSLENNILENLSNGQIYFGDENFSPIQVSIEQFFGIEINDFAVTVAKTALWIAESQMMKKTEQILHHNLEFLPLKSYANIIEANALQIDWNEVVSKDKLNYIVGNPPFVGKKEQNKEQKLELLSVFDKNIKGIGNIDYVSGWYVKAVKYIQNTLIKVAFVSTNSITQGEQVPIIWEFLLEYNINIIFAYRTFKWNSEAKEKAAVHCVIIGFVCFHDNLKRRIYLNESKYQDVENINPYLINAPMVFIENRNENISNVAEILYGSMPIDDGHLILSDEERELLLKENIENEKYIKKYAGGNEIINSKDRWCLWLKGISPKEIRQSSIIMNRIAATEEFRRNSDRPQTKKLADVPYLFGEIRQPNTKMLVIPKVSSESRKYIPISIIEPTTIINGSALIVPNASYYEFGILISNVHMAWMRTVAGRMKSDYQYSGTIVYNNFPWPNSTEEQRQKIEKTAQAILDARNLYTDSTLADLYDEITMPPELRKAHQNNDKAVMEAYGFPVKNTFTESQCVAELMKMYEEITKL